MRAIGKQIRKYRNEKGYTQEQLGRLLGVSTQAVSKWENGGTPDIELLPKLSDVLGVSVDALFGRADQDEAEDISLIDKYLDFFTGPPSNDADLKDYYTKIMQDSGMATVRISDDFRHFFLMTEPRDSIKSFIGDVDRLRSVFAVFADEKLLRIIFYMYSRLNTPVTTAVISSKTDIAEDELEECMETLCRNNGDHDARRRDQRVPVPTGELGHSDALHGRRNHKDILLRFHLHLPPYETVAMIYQLPFE